MNKNNMIILAAVTVINILGFIAFEGNGYGKLAKIIFLDVGQGDATLILAENDNQILVDGGDGKKIMDKLGRYMPFYDHAIELVVITHPDRDHAGGLAEVLKYYDVKEILQTKYTCDTELCKELDKVISEKKISRRYAKPGQTINAGNQIVQVVSAGSDDADISDENDNSIVLKAYINEKSVLIMADAGFKIENQLIGRGVDVDSDILRISHHGSKSATSDDFVQKVSPSMAIISVGKNKYGHPSEEVMNRLRNLNVKTLRTDEIGDIAVQ